MRWENMALTRTDGVAEEEEEDDDDEGEEDPGSEALAR